MSETKVIPNGASQLLTLRDWIPSIRIFCTIIHAEIIVPIEEIVATTR
jgi:hypothetical protein